MSAKTDETGLVVGTDGWSHFIKSMGLNLDSIRPHDFIGRKRNEYADCSVIPEEL